MSPHYAPLNGLLLPCLMRLYVSSALQAAMSFTRTADGFEDYIWTRREHVSTMEKLLLFLLHLEGPADYRWCFHGALLQLAHADTIMLHAGPGALELSRHGKYWSILSAKRLRRASDFRGLKPGWNQLSTSCSQMLSKHPACNG